MPFNQSMTLPMELRLISTADGPRLTWTAVKELETLRASTMKVDDMLLTPTSSNPFSTFHHELVELRLDIEPRDASEVTLNVRGAKIVFDPAKQELTVNGHRAPAPLRNGHLPLAIYCDRASLEVFASDGLTYIPMPFIPKPEDLSISIATKGGAAQLRDTRAYELRPAWNAQL
jgi:sucrose-6-phosphate hydrolase SacC (GH32 family)